MAVFIILPFIAFFLGVNFGKQSALPTETLVSSTTDDAENGTLEWGTYTNERLGVELKYPTTGWHVTEFGEDLILYDPETTAYLESFRKEGYDPFLDGPTGPADIVIEFDDNNEKKTVEEFELHYLNGEYINDPIVDEREVNGKRVVVYDEKIIVDAGSYFVTLRSGNADYNDILNEMLNSLRF